MVEYLPKKNEEERVTAGLTQTVLINLGTKMVEAYATDRPQYVIRGGGNGGGGGKLAHANTLYVFCVSVLRCM